MDEVQVLCKHTHQQILNGENRTEHIQVFSVKQNKDRTKKIFSFLPSLNTEEFKMSGEMNPFMQNSISSKENCTPGFMSKGGSNVFGFQSDDRLKESIEAGFDTPDRYLYEFYHRPQYEEFKKEYLKYLKKYTHQEDLVRYIKIGAQATERNMLFLEILDTFVMISKTELTTLPYYCYVSKRIAKKFGFGEFYVYLRPFTFGFLNVIKEIYDLAIYSSLNKNFLIFLMDIIQKEKEFFNICITHETSDEPKSILKFMREGRSSKNTLFIDHDPEVLAYNSAYSLPIPKFVGEQMDSTLLYLQKYLIDLNQHPDLSSKLRKDFRDKMTD